MNQRMMLLVICPLLLTLGCGGDDPAGPASTLDPLVIGTVSLPNAAPTVAYSVTLAATGGDGSYTWSVTIGRLPLGLSLTAGAITGTPNAVSIRSFSVQVTSGDGQSTTQTLTITVAGPPFCSGQPDSAIPTFEDAILEALIRATLSIGAQDDLTCGLVSGLTVLDALFVPISSLAGVENLTSLTDLILRDNSITDISALSGLTSLTFLDLEWNSIIDISPLSRLTSLGSLRLNDNSITDISPLSGLTSLTSLNLSRVRASSRQPELGITDLSPLSGLTSLTFLDLFFQSITDISALSGLTSLRSLNLGRNLNVSDIQPLLDNTGLGAGATVDLSGTGVSCGDVAALEAKGVLVQEGHYIMGTVLVENCL